MKSAQYLTSVALIAATVATVVTTGGLGLESTSSAASTHASCTNAQIVVSRRAPQGTAGTTYVPLVFTNTRSACTIDGVPAIQPVTGTPHRPLGPAARNGSMGEMPALHLLARGKSVSVAFGIVDTGNFPAASCVARRASGLVVSLGSFVHPRYVEFSFEVCTKRASTITRLISPGVTGY